MTSHDLVAAVARNRLKQALPAVLLLGLSACAGTSTGVVTRYPGGSVSEPSATASTSSAATTSHAAGSSAASAEAALARGDAAGAAAREARGRGRHDVVETLGDLPDLLARHGVDVRQTAQRARHRRLRHTRGLRDIERRRLIHCASRTPRAHVR